MDSRTYLNSSRWNEWIAWIDIKTCLICRSLNGKILLISDIWPYDPPIHPNCRCRIGRVRALLAGTATNMGTDGADWYLKHLGRLPDYYISKLTAKYKGWLARLFNLPTVAPGKMIGGDQFYNSNEKLPWAPERKWYEADINYTGGRRNTERILYSSDGLIFVTYDHYETFIEII